MTKEELNRKIGERIVELRTKKDFHNPIWQEHAEKTDKP